MDGIEKIDEAEHEADIQFINPIFYLCEKKCDLNSTVLNSGIVIGKDAPDQVRVEIQNLYMKAFFNSPNKRVNDTAWLVHRQIGLSLTVNYWSSSHTKSDNTNMQ